MKTTIDGAEIVLSLARLISRRQEIEAQQKQLNAEMDELVERSKGLPPGVRVFVQEASLRAVESDLSSRGRPKLHIKAPLKPLAVTIIENIEHGKVYRCAELGHVMFEKGYFQNIKKTSRGQNICAAVKKNSEVFKYDAGKISLRIKDKQDAISKLLPPYNK